jgi:hypothetical protein
MAKIKDSDVLEMSSTVEAVAVYKRVLKKVLDNRPSGLRRKLAQAIRRNPSFVSQITNPGYSVPIPAAHIEKIFDVCRLSPDEREEFLVAYAEAHPNRAIPRDLPDGKHADRQLILTVPDLGSSQANRQFDAAIETFVRRLTPLLRNNE